MELRTTRHTDGTWWIHNVPVYVAAGVTCTECGPYDTRREADDGRRGLERFYRRNPEYANNMGLCTHEHNTMLEPAGRTNMEMEAGDA